MPDARAVVVRVGDTEIARTRHAVRVLETASPPTFYLPLGDIRSEFLEAATGASGCEWKGEARYWTVVAAGTRLDRVAWSYPDPLPGFEAIRNALSFYPGRIACYVDDIRVAPQPGGFYGGWITPEVTGPFKGDGGTSAW